MDKIKQDSSTLAWNNLGDEWFDLAQKGENRNYFIMPDMPSRITLYLYFELKK